MSKAATAVATIVLVVSLFFVTSLQGPDAQQDQMAIASEDLFKSLQRPPVSFNHRLHSEIYSNCVECHHVYEYNNGKRENAWAGEEQTCAECHRMRVEDRKPGLMDAFHQNCTGCHRSMAAENQPTGPVTCGECHIRGQ